MSILSIPNTFSAGAVIIASQHNSNFSVIYSDYNGNIDNTNIAPAAAIAYTKLVLTGSIVNADVSASAAIVDTKLAQITTASKVSGAAITLLTSLPSGAGVVPTANLGSGTANSTTFLSGAQTYLPISGKQIFTSSGTFTAPTGVTKVLLSGVGAGGGGGGVSGASRGGGGAGGQQVFNFPYTVVAGNSYTVTINAGGSAGAGGGGDGGVGGSTVFDALTIAGGNFGQGSTAGSAGGAASSPTATSATGGVQSVSGGGGFTGSGSTGGGGGGSGFGAGGVGGAGVNGTAAGANTGAGGGGGGGNGSTGGAGGTGILIVQW